MNNNITPSNPSQTPKMPAFNQRFNYNFFWGIISLYMMIISTYRFNVLIDMDSELAFFNAKMYLANFFAYSILFLISTKRLENWEKWKKMNNVNGSDNIP